MWITKGMTKSRSTGDITARAKKIWVVYNGHMSTKFSLVNLLEKLRQELPSIEERYQVESLEVFGSYLHAKEQASSDLDLLVEFSELPGFFKFIELENYLSDKLGIKVDLVMKDSLKPAIGKRVLSETIHV
jgi:predicted nucleotidyltransferase